MRRANRKLDFLEKARKQVAGPIKAPATAPSLPAYTVNSALVGEASSKLVVVRDSPCTKTPDHVEVGPPTTSGLPQRHGEAGKVGHSRICGMRAGVGHGDPAFGFESVFLRSYERGYGARPSEAQ
jgi:hypothetical protein